MKIILKTAFLFVLVGFSVPSQAYDNEPDGFRGILWGASPSSIEGLEGSGEAVTVLSQFGMSLGDIPLTSYYRKEDKLEFNGVEIEKIVYFFITTSF